MSELNYTVTADNTGFVETMNDTKNHIRQTTREIEKSGMTIDEFTSSMQKLLGSFDKMTAAVDKNTQAQEQVAQAGKKAADEEKRGADKATEAIQGTTAATKELGEEFEQTSGVMSQGLDKLTKYAAGFLTLQAGKEFIQKVTSIRGEFQKLEVAFTTMLGSEQRAQELMQQLTRTAAITPFDLKGVADGAKQLLAYGVAAENVNDTLIHLGDIAAGLSIPLNDLVMLYGTTMTQGRMFTQDLRQFMGRGIPLADELAKQFGVTKDKVGELVTAGKVGAEEFNKAIMSMSSEGGKFAGLMEAQSQTIAGQISNIEDAIDVMFNEIGQANEGVINDVLGSVSTLVENYKKVGAVLMDAVVAIGLYKTALITAHAIEKASIAIKQALAVQEALLTMEAKKLAAARGISVAAARAELGSVNVLTVAKMRLIAATKALTAAMAANPYTAVAVAIAAVAFGVYKLATAESVETAARRRANEEMQTFADKLEEQQNKIKSYIQTLQDETATEYQKAVAWEMLNKMAPTLTEKYDKATIATLDLAEATKELNEQADKANYEHIRSEVQKWKETIDRIKQNMLDDARYTGGKNAIFNLMQLEDAETQLDQYLKKLVEIERIRKKIAEDNKPLEIRIQEANDNIKTKEAVYSFYKRAADLAGELKNAHDIAAGVIANSSIPTDYQAIADDTRKKYDELIAELEADVEDLRTKIAESPASLELEKELKGKEQALNDLLQMKRQWDWSGATTIPLTFVTNFSQVEKDLQDARNGRGINTQGMRFDGPTGRMVPDEATAPETHTAAQWRKDAYNNWKSAQAAVDSFWQKKETMDKATFDKEYKKLKDAADQAKKDYDKLKSSNDSEAKKNIERKKQHQEYIALIAQQRKERERAEKDLEYSTTQARIDAMNEGTSKTLAQLKLNFEKQKTAIERAYEDLKQQKIEEAKKEFEANPANKNRVFDPSTVNTKYSKAETDNYLLQLEANEKAYERSLAEQRKLQEQALRDYIRTYGSIQDQKKAISKEYAQKIADEEGEIQKRTLEAERDRLLSELDFKELQQSIDWESVFGDLSRQSVSALRELKAKLKQALDTKDITAENAKVLSEKILEIENTITDKTDILASILPGLRERKRLTEQATAAEQLYMNALNKEAESINKVLDDKKQIQALLNSQDIRDAFGEKITVELEAISEENKENLLSSLEKGSDLYNQLLQLFENLAADTTIQNSNHQTTEQRRNYARELKSSLDSGSFKQVMGDLFNFEGMGLSEIASLAATNAQSLAEFTDKIGLTGTDFGDAVHGFADGVNGFNNALQSLASGDVFGAVNGVLDGFAGIGRMIDSIGGGFLFGNDDEYQAALDKWGWLLDTWEENLRYEKELMEKAYGGKILELQQKTIEDLRKTQQAAADVYRGWAGSGAGWFSHSNGYNANEDVNWDYLRQYDYGLWSQMDGNIGNLFNLDWKKLDELKHNLPQFWQTLHGEAQKYLDQYIEAGKAIEETIDSVNEKMNTISKETFFDDFLNSLYELADGSEEVFDDIAKYWQRMINRMVVNNFIADGMEEDIERVYLSLANLNKRRANGQISDEQYKKELDGIVSAYNENVQRAQDTMQQFVDLGIVKPIEDATEETVKYFSNLRDMWLSTLMDMEADTESWQQEITRIMVEDLINSLVLGDDFNAWMENWRERYAEEIAHGGDTDRLNSLIAEMVAKRKQLAQQSKDIMDDLGYSDFFKDEEDIFESLHSDFLDALMDMNTDAEEWGKKIAQTLARQIIEQELLNQAFDGLLDEWKSAVADLVQHDLGHIGGDEQTLDMLKGKIAEIVEKYKELAPLAQEFLEGLGLIEEVKPESPFDDLRTQFLNTLMSMEGDAEGFRKDLQKILTQSLIEKFVLNDDFDKYLEEWNERYMAILNDGNKSQEEIEAALDAMIEELVQKREMTLEQAEKLRERLKEEDTTFKDMKENWTSALLDMEMTAESFAESVRQIMAEKIINQFLLGSSFQRFLDRYQDTVNTIMDGEGTMDEKIAALLPMVDEWVAKYEELAPLAERIREAFGIVPNEFASAFGDLRNTFVSALMDMESDADSFAQNISKIMSQAFIDKFVLGEQFDRQMKEWQERYASIVNGEMSEEERARQLKQLADAIAAAKEGYTEQAKAIQDLFGLTVYEDQEATMNTSEKATYDQFETFLGIAVAQQMATLQGNEVRLQILATLQAMSGITTPGSDTVKEIRTMLNTTNEYLLAIKKAAEGMYKDFGLKLDTLNSKITELI